MSILRFLLAVVVLVAMALGALTVAARLSDGPIGPFAGGPFASGDVHVGAEPDWRFVKDRETVEFQLLEPARSRTSWILEQNGRIFIPCGYMNSTWGRLWKQWPIEAEQNGQALLRIDDALYPRRLVRIHDGPLVAPLVAQISRKYGVPATVDAVTSGALWLFELAPRAPGAAR